MRHPCCRDDISNETNERSVALADARKRCARKRRNKERRDNVNQRNEKNAFAAKTTAAQRVSSADAARLERRARRRFSVCARDGARPSPRAAKQSLTHRDNAAAPPAIANIDLRSNEPSMTHHSTSRCGWHAAVARTLNTSVVQWLDAFEMVQWRADRKADQRPDMSGDMTC